MDADHGFPSRVKSDRLGMLLSDRHGCYYVIGMNVIERSPCVGICKRWPAEKVMALYRCRWQIELLFKELKSHNRLKAFATRQKAIAEGLIWASLLALLVKRLALTLIGSAELSMLKIAKNSALWLMPILASIIHGAWQEITEKLEWAMVYLSKNGKKSRQRKSKQNNTLDGIINSLAA